MSGSHPSFLQLDRLAAGASVDRSVHAHLETCAECDAYVRSLRSPATLPEWLPSVEKAVNDDHAARSARSLAYDPPRSQRAGRRSPRWALRATAAAAAVAATVALFSLNPTVRTALNNRPAGSGYSTVRGEPSVGLYVKRGARVWLWDGHSTIQPRDQLRLKVVPEGLGHVAVYTPDTKTRRLNMIYSASIDPRQEHLLPRAWRVDATGTEEHLVVVLAHDRLAGESLAGRSLDRWSAAATTLWVRTLRLQKAKEARR